MGMRALQPIPARDPLFTIITDHEPLLCIWKKSRPPLRIERWGLRLQPYNYVMKYIPGSNNPTDYMSRNPIHISGTHRHQKMAEQYVNFIAPSSIPRAMKIEDVKQATEDDDMMQRVITLPKWTLVPNSENGCRNAEGVLQRSG